MFRKNFNPNHLFALETTARIGNSTARAVGIAYNGNNSQSSMDYWRRHLGDLEKRGYLKSKAVYADGKGQGKSFRLGTFFCLTKKGANLVAEARGEEEGSVYFPAGGIEAKSPLHFAHRSMFIELMGAFITPEDREKNGFEVQSIISYFRKEGSNRNGNGRALSAVTLPLKEGEKKPIVVVPDGMLWVRVGENMRLCAVEFHKETSADGIIKQLEKHSRALDAGLFRKKFNHPYDNCVLSVHNDTNKLKTVIKEIRDGKIKNFERYAGGYYFASFEEIIENGLKSSFYSITGQKCEIFN